MSNAATGFTVWLTGMAGSGKSTLAKYLSGRFQALGRAVEVLEGNEVNELFAKGLGETKEERNLLVKRLGFTARGITRAQGVAIVPALSPYRDARDQLRREIGRFVEVFVDCPVDVLMQRDNTGRYKKAMNGEIPNFVGITDPYEPPANPEVTVHTDQEQVAEAAERIFQSLLDLGFLKPDDVHLLAGKALKKGKPGKQKANKAPPAKIAKPASAKGKPAARREVKPAAKARPAAHSAKAKPAKKKAR